HQAFGATVTKCVLTVDDRAAIVLEFRDGSGGARFSAAFAQRTTEEDDFRVIKFVFALAQGHTCRPRIGPDTRKGSWHGLEPDQSQARGFCFVLLKRELGLQKAPLVDHGLTADPFGSRRLTRSRVKRLYDIPVPDELFQEFLTSSRL